MVTTIMDIHAVPSLSNTMLKWSGCSLLAAITDCQLFTCLKCPCKNVIIKKIAQSTVNFAIKISLHMHISFYPMAE